MAEAYPGAGALTQNIKRLCEQNGMTQKELAERAGITSVSVSRYCSGTRTPSANTLYAMAKALGCRMDELMEGVEMVPDDGTE